MLEIALMGKAHKLAPNDQKPTLKDRMSLDVNYWSEVAKTVDSDALSLKMGKHYAVNEKFCLRTFKELSESFYEQ